MDSLALCDPAIMRRILANKIPEKLKSDPELDALLNDLFKEVEDDYTFSIRKAIGKYTTARLLLVFIGHSIHTQGHSSSFLTIVLRHITSLNIELQVNWKAYSGGGGELKQSK